MAVTQELDIDTDEIDTDSKPEPVTLELAGKQHTFHWTKDHHWIVFYSSYNSGQNMYLPTLELLAICAGVEWPIINQRLNSEADPLDASDLLTAVLELASAWETHTLHRMEEIGVEVPKKFKDHIGNRKQRRTVKAPVSRRR